MDQRLSKLIDWVGVSAEKAQGLLVPVSGGSDSALCFWICTQALPNRTHAAHVGNNLRERSWFEKLGNLELLSIPEGVDNHEAFRWAAMISKGLKEHWWLVGSRNRTEQVFGTYSLASRVATYLPIVGLWKSEVMQLCKEVGVPQEILDSSTRADPDCGRSEEMAEVPLDVVDRYLKVRECELPLSDSQCLDPNHVRYLDGIYRSNRFKGALPLVGPRPS